MPVNPLRGALPRRKNAIVIYADGSCISEGSRDHGPCGIGVVIEDGRGNVRLELTEMIRPGTPTYAEYQAVIRGMELARMFYNQDTTSITVYGDCLPMIQTINGEMIARFPSIQRDFRRIKELAGKLGGMQRINFKYMDFGSNHRAHKLSRIATRKFRHTVDKQAGT
jgi:ribonuclease HI